MDREREGEIRCTTEQKTTHMCNISKHISNTQQTVTCMMAVELGGVKTGGLSLMSEMSMFRVTVEDMAGEPLSKACTVKEYLDT